MKDKVLDKIYLTNNNIAQYISFKPNREKPNYIHIKNYTPENSTNKDIILNLINSSKSKSVNIRSFSPERMKGNKLIFNKKKSDIYDILNIVEQNKQKGFYSIINENIDINDGGVSGVIFQDLIEFSPHDTPKCVEKEGVCSLPKTIGLKLLEMVYGFAPRSNFPNNFRVEFSIHPQKQGVLEEHTIIWEIEEYSNEIKNHNSSIIWPNNFSKFIGDKVFGLLIANILGFKTPFTTTIARNTPPFSFGERTGSKEKWLRTCPIEKTPGKYFSGNYWVDPFKLISEEETTGNNKINIASLLSQDSIEAEYSGASIIGENENDDIIEGVKGKGDSFMIGENEPETLPENILKKVKELNDKLRLHFNLLGNISIEWVCDKNTIWIVQLNQLKSKSSKYIIVEGNPKYYMDFDIKKGLENLRTKISEIQNKNIGINLIGKVGITSHFGDILRIANIPSTLKRS